MDRLTKAFKSYKGVVLLFSERSFTVYVLVYISIITEVIFLTAKLLIILEMSAIDSEIFIKNLLRVMGLKPNGGDLSSVYESPAAVPQRHNIK